LKKANIISAIIGMIFSIVTFGYTFTFKKFQNVPVGPEFFPRALAVVLFIFCTALLISSIIHKETAKEKEKGSPTISPLNKNMQKAIAGLLIIVVYALLWEIVGFLIVTPIAVFLMIFLLGKRDYRNMIIVSIIATIVIFCAFKFLLSIELPMGIIEDIIYFFEDLGNTEDEEEIEEAVEVGFNFIKSVIS